MNGLSPTKLNKSIDNINQPTSNHQNGTNLTRSSSNQSNGTLNKIEFNKEGRVN